MPVLTQTPMTGPGQRIATPNTITSSDTFTYTYGQDQMILFLNTTGGSITPRVRGVGATNIPVPGADNSLIGGPGPVGWDRTIDPGELAVVVMDEFRFFWGNGGTSTVEITNGAGLTCWILGA